MDQFEKTLQEIVTTLNKRITAAEERIASDNQVIEEAKAEVLTFQRLLESYEEKKASDREAAATFYTSGRTDDDTQQFLSAINVELPEELQPPGEVLKEAS